MSDRLPTKLINEPLVDAVFEIRFQSKVSASDVLPGYLYGKLKGETKTERLSAAEVPKAVRDNTPNLKHAPLVRMHWRNYVVSIGDNNVVVGCKMPYPGWAEFRSSIFEILQEVSELDVVESVYRFSLKYVDLIPSQDLEEQVSFVDSSIRIGSHALRSERFHFRLELPENDLIQILTIASSAAVQDEEGNSKQGLVIDVDSILENPDGVRSDWIGYVEKQIDRVKLRNKETFFDCLSDKALELAEPIYE
ncbi:TIGR04255 family protein [Guyparkeria sp. TX1]|uniref:TIGR04255 family protein n=1 Tax=Guyparkeria sp. TX1 TaxID=3115001 RepID=UPI003977DF99